MRLKKIYNNNIVLCEDIDNQEVILIGLGIAFSAKVGQPIDESKIERKFVLDSNDAKKSMDSIPYLEITNKIVDYAQPILKTNFPDDVYIAICDHINFAVRRYSNHQSMKNALLWEIKKYYKKEFELAQGAIKIINRELNVELDDNEAGFIALHFVNGQRSSNEMNETIQQIKMVEDVMKFVNYQLHFVPCDDDIYYQRFLVHLRFLIQRLFENEQEQFEDEALRNVVSTNYCSEYLCAVKIAQHIKEEYGFVLLKNEITFLALHLYRMINREN